VLLRLRIGAADITVGLEDLRPFGDAADVTRLELPMELRSAHLSAVGNAVWRELEAMFQRSVELVDVRLGGTTTMTADCLGFELGRDPSGPSTRGFVRAPDLESQKILSDVSKREMPRARLPTDLRIPWVAVVGHTTLSVDEVRALELQDIVLIDDADYTAETLGCRLAAGAGRRYVGRGSLQLGRLHLAELTTRENMSMKTNNSSEAPGEDTPLEEAAFGEIEVQLRFEIAQWNATLADVASLQAGTVIDVGQRIDGQSVSVWSERRCIARGQLVSVGDHLGVRLSSVFGLSVSEPVRKGAEAGGAGRTDTSPAPLSGAEAAAVE
jgi:type III secretion system YscQ/HrcQ family protein